MLVFIAHRILACERLSFNYVLRIPDAVARRVAKYCQKCVGKKVLTTFATTVIILNYFIVISRFVIDVFGAHTHCIRSFSFFFLPKGEKNTHKRFGALWLWGNSLIIVFQTFSQIAVLRCLVCYWWRPNAICPNWSSIRNCINNFPHRWKEDETAWKWTGLHQCKSNGATYVVVEMQTPIISTSGEFSPYENETWMCGGSCFQQ